MLEPGLPALGAGGPPAIPGVRASGNWNQPEHLLFWVRSGSACIRVEGHPESRLGAGEGVWIPAAVGSDWTVVTEAGTVAFPLLTRPNIASDAVVEPRRFAISEGWQDWLIQHFTLAVTPLMGHGHSQDALADLLRGSSAWTPELSGAPGANAAHPPAMPTTRSARAVADELIRNPVLDLTVAEWAAHVLTSPRTLRRDFVAGTGLTFEQWRLRCRLSAAVELLVAGCGVDEVAARVGFASRSGFARAFSHQFGSTPTAFGRAFTARAAQGDLARHAAVARRADHLATMVRAGRSAPAAPGLLPATRTSPHTNQVHVLCWSYRGAGYLDVGERRYDWGRGVATWIPAGVEHVTGLHQDSISLPIGDASTADLSLAEPLQAQFSPAWDDYLMFCSISARTPLHAEGYTAGHVLELFADQVAAQRAMSVPMPEDARARRVAMDYLRRIGTSGATGPDVPVDIRRAFREQTGMSFARWRYAARMRVARDLIAGGAKPSSVARRVGYAHLPTFSAAFTRFHGLSPREYRERETEAP